MPVKRERHTTPTPHSNFSEPESKHTPKKSPETPKKPRKTPTKSTPTTSTLEDGNEEVNLTPRGIFAMMIIEAGIKAVSKSEVEEKTGLKPGQQHDLIRKDGKGTLRKALVKCAEGL